MAVHRRYPPGCRTLQKMYEKSFEGQSASDPKCYRARVQADVPNIVAAKPKVVRIGTACGVPSKAARRFPRQICPTLLGETAEEGTARLAGVQDLYIRTAAIFTEGTEKGEVRHICPNPDCPVHQPE